MKRFTIAVDLAKKRDYFALMVFEAIPHVKPGSPLFGNPDRTVMKYEVVYIDKERELRYPDMVRKTVHVAGYKDIKNDYDLIVDGTGVGEAAVDYLRDAGLYPIPIVFTNGTQVNEIYEDIGKVFADVQDRLRASKTLKELRVPKKDLVTAGQILMQQRRIGVTPDCPFRQDFENQLMGFTGKINELTRHVKYEAEDERVHDDLVVCYLMGSWWALNSGTIDGFKERVLPAKGKTTIWEPVDYY